MTSTPVMSDPFAVVQERTEDHRREHRCWAYPYENGSLVGTIAAIADAKRILEIGTALGYTSLWFAHAVPAAHVDTVERDPDHARIARSHFEEFGLADRVTLHEGDAAQVVADLEPGYDLAFFDGYGPTVDALEQLRRLLRVGGVLIAGNLVYSEDSAGDTLLDADRWLTTSLGETAFCVKR